MIWELVIRCHLFRVLDSAPLPQPPYYGIIIVELEMLIQYHYRVYFLVIPPFSLLLIHCD